ncbi:MAG: glycosyltransferase family 4 protein [Burkholderiales bacterium]
MNAPRAPLALCNHALRNSGGIERYALTVVRGLHAQGIRPVVIAKTFDADLPEYAWVEPLRVRMTGVPAKLRDHYFDWRIARLKRKHDLFPLLACNQTAAADIAICGGVHPGYLEAMDQQPGWADRWKTRLECAHLNNAQVVVAHSQRMADEVQRFHGVSVDKIRLLYPPVDGELFTTVDTETRNRLRGDLGLPTDRAVFLLASTGHRRKGLNMLIDFFASTKLPVCLVVAGRPIGSVNSLPPNVRSLGYRNDIENVYRAVDFTVMASIYEPFGLVGVESVLCGTPVLVAANVGCAEVLRPPAGLVFDLQAAEESDSSFSSAIAEAVRRWRAGTHRLDNPTASIVYNTSVRWHVEALLDIARGLCPSSESNNSRNI